MRTLPIGVVVCVHMEKGKSFLQWPSRPEAFESLGSCLTLIMMQLQVRSKRCHLTTIQNSSEISIQITGMTISWNLENEKQ